MVLVCTPVSGSLKWRLWFTVSWAAKSSAAPIYSAPQNAQVCKNFSEGFVTGRGYSFFIKRCASLHEHLYRIVRRICLDGAAEDEWFYSGITYLIPKGTPAKGSDFRPITCMSNLYKLTTMCVACVMQLAVTQRRLLAENQLGTVAGVLGAKEQAMLNTAVNKFHLNKLKTTWIDVTAKRPINAKFAGPRNKAPVDR
ncbi:hypothetical protein PAPHI01_2036 [Pancytospora philotis]|nr:hypothetical protein PAPHI01_2036 [Pancytospora philotis]